VTSNDDVKQTVLGFFELAVGQKRPDEARRQYMGRTYTQHNPDMADGPEAMVQGLSGFFAQFPDMRYDIKRTAVDGDLVWIHGNVVTTPGEPGMACVDIFRVDDGKIVEHWDVLQPVPAEPANSNTMF
jgi:predicted SnoaL-like aldol condensation-catalyzing enzyme